MLWPCLTSVWLTYGVGARAGCLIGKRLSPRLELVSDPFQPSGDECLMPQGTA
jgi:hypothetical protein